MYYLYELKSSNTNDNRRYIGITKDIYKRFQKHRHSRKNGYNKSIWVEELISNDYELLMNVIDEHEEQNMIFLLEKLTIKIYKTIGFDLLNMTEGGIAPQVTEEILRKRRETNLKNRAKDPEKYNKIITPEHREVLNEAVRKAYKEGKIKKYNCKKIYQYSLEGALIKEFESVSQCERDTKIVWNTIKYNIKRNNHLIKGFLWFLDKMPKEEINNLINNKNKIK